MKKIIALVILLVCVFSLCSCGVMGVLSWPLDWLLAAGLISPTSPDYEGEPETFHYEELAVTLTDAFYLSAYYDGGASYDSLSGTTVSIDEYQFMYSQYSAGLTPEKYAAQMREELLAEDESVSDGTIVDIEVGEVVNDGELVYFEYQTKVLVSFACLRAVYVGGDSLYAVTFTCDAADVETYRPYFIAWARTVVLNNVNSEA